jgi:hypothetical protein
MKANSLMGGAFDASAYRVERTTASIARLYILKTKYKRLN